MPTIRPLLVGLLATLVAAAGLVVVSAAPAQACSYALSTPRAMLERSDTVFTATLTDIEPPPPRRVMSSADPATYTFDVATVYRGSSGAEVDVRSAVSGASCGLEWMRVGTDYLVFATEQDGELWSGLCSGTAPVSQAPVDRIARLSLDPGARAAAALRTTLGVTLGALRDIAAL